MRRFFKKDLKAKLEFVKELSTVQLGRDELKRLKFSISAPKWRLSG